MESADIGEIGQEKIGKLPVISIDSKGKKIAISKEGVEIETTVIFNKDDQVKLEFGNEYAGVFYDNGQPINEALDYARALKGSNPLDIASNINDWISKKSLLANRPEEIQKLRDPTSQTYYPELADWIEDNIIAHTKLWSKPVGQLNAQHHPKLSEVMAKTNKEGKFYGVCKHMAVLSTAMLQEAGVPAWIQSGTHTLTDDGHEGLHAWTVFLNTDGHIIGLDSSSRSNGKGILSTDFPEIFDNFAVFTNSPKKSFETKFETGGGYTYFSIRREFENYINDRRTLKALTERSKLKLCITPNKPFEGILSGAIEGGVRYDPHSPEFPYKIISIDRVHDLPFEIKFGNNLLTAQKRPI